MSSVLLLRVAAAWPLPGLGLLALPAGPTPHLAGCPLHTALHVVVRLPEGPAVASTATVEEVQADAAPTAAPQRALLLAWEQPVLPGPGAEIWLAEAPA